MADPPEDPVSSPTFKASPELLHLCKMDSLMPSSSRSFQHTKELPSSPSISSILFGEDALTVRVPLREQSPSSTTKVTTTIHPSPKSISKILFGNETLDMGGLTRQASQPHLGAWASPLKFSDTFNGSAGKQVPMAGFSKQPVSEEWPALTVNHPNISRKQRAHISSSQAANVEDSLSPSSAVGDDLHAISSEYPWAAKMRSKCNLHRVTTPTYLEDGTPMVCIPPSVLLKGLDHQREFIVGQFKNCSAPPGGLIHGMATRIWGKKCKIFTKQLGESSYLFHIPDEATRNWVISRGIWYVDDCLMFVSAWNPSETISLPEIKTIPIWLTLKNIPFQLYSIEGIDWIASGIGEPMLTSKPWLDPTSIGEAKILVEVKLDRPFPKRVALQDKEGTISLVDIIYSWLPSSCTTCGQLGHKANRCLGVKAPKVATNAPKNTHVTGSDILATSKEVGAISTHSALLQTTAPMVSIPTFSTATTTFLAFPPSLAIEKSPPKVTSEAENTIQEADITPAQLDLHSVATGTNTESSTETATLSPSGAEQDLNKSPNTPKTATLIEEDSNMCSELSLVKAADTRCERNKMDTTAGLEVTDPTSEIETSEEVAGIASSDANCTVSFTSSHAVNLPLDEVFSSSPPLFVPGPGTTAASDDDLIHRTRGGRLIKPSLKGSEFEWTEVGGRGKRGRGRGPKH
ncbi:hypothetical protein HA466_0242440 [Hirschfeldia incana]|nr:hypothetical protein HA466_0242440 [Hirschfeldia incana]